jgi:hypothetical protein
MLFITNTIIIQYHKRKKGDPVITANEVTPKPPHKKAGGPNIQNSLS